MTRQIFTGAGKVGSESARARRPTSPSSCRQRAEFFEEEVGLETTLKRPIVNTRDEPHADPQRYRRLHVIVGDANLCEVATFLKVGTTALVLALIEDDAFGGREPGPGQPGAGHPPGLLRPDAHPRRSRWPTGATATALAVQWELSRLARKYAEDRGLECLGDEAVGQEVLRRWEDVLHGLETDPTSWPARSTGRPSSSCSRPTGSATGCDWDDQRLAAVDLQYHDLRPERSLFARLDTERLVDAGRRWRPRSPTRPGRPGPTSGASA